jgi:predicted nucleic acid-binding Zn finger protein
MNKPRYRGCQGCGFFIVKSNLEPLVYVKCPIGCDDVVIKLKKDCKPVIGVDMANGIDEWVVTSLLTHNDGIISSSTGKSGYV